MYRTIIIVLVLSTFISSCKKEDLESIDQPVLFEFQYINHAWGYTHNGWLIDEDGNVKGFNLPDKWNFPDEDNRINKADLIENVASTDTLYRKADESKLLKHFGERLEMKGAVMDTSDIYIVDAGIAAYYVYIWDNKNDDYERILLASEGDLSVTNKSSEAKAAVKWLKEIGEGY